MKKTTLIVLAALLASAAYADIGTISNGEANSSVRGKINAAITGVNTQSNQIAAIEAQTNTWNSVTGKITQAAAEALFVEDAAAYEAVASAATNPPIAKFAKSNTNTVASGGVHGIYAGQSNELGYPQGIGGVTADQLSGLADTWMVVASDSYSYTGAVKVVDTDRWGPEIVSADLITKTLATNLYITKVAYNGNPISGFLAGGARYIEITNNVAYAITQGAPSPQFMDWGQGEADSDTVGEATNYYANLVQLRSDYQTLYPGLKFIVHGLSDSAITNYAYADTVLAAQKQFCETYDDCYFIDTRGLNAPNGSPAVHYDAPSMINLGGRVGGIVTSILNSDGVNLGVAKAAIGEIHAATGTVQSLSVETADVGSLTVNGSAISTGGLISPYNLEFYLPFEDATTNLDWTGTYVVAEEGTVTHEYDADRRGGVITLDGDIANHLVLSNSLPLSSKMTICFWQKFTAETATNYSYYVFGQKTNDNGTGTCWWRSVPNPSLKYQVFYSKPNALSNTTFIASPTIADYTTWHHYALTVDSGTNTLYVDGVLNTSSYDADTVDPVNFIKYIGAGAFNSVTPNEGGFDGSLDEFMVFDRPLTSTEVYDLYSEQDKGATGLKQ